MPAGFYFPTLPHIYFHELQPEGEEKIGRAPQNQICLPDPLISRFHARVICSPKRHFLIDESRHGTEVNGQKIDRHPLKHQDQITMGRFRFEYRLQRPKVALQHRPTQSIPQCAIIGESQGIADMLQMAQQIAPQDFPVLITGETGTGKELLAHYLHQHSKRLDQPFLDLNCAALTPHLLESELFGHEKGAFTGAHQKHEGLLTATGRGTLFLDELGELPLELQAKLLRILETQSYRRVGSLENQMFQGRVLAATNRDLITEMEQGKFREDLYHRLSVFTIHCPPLRERLEDLDELVHFLLTQANLPKSISPQALKKLQSYSWPGNIRQLRNVLVKAAILCPKNTLDPVHLHLPNLPEKIPILCTVRPILNEPKNLWETEEELLRQQLEQNRWHRAKTADALGIARSTLFQKMKKHGLV